MYNDIEEIYIANKNAGRKYKKGILPIILILTFATVYLLLKREELLAFVPVLAIIISVIIFKIIVYFAVVKPEKTSEWRGVKERYQKLVNNKTKQDIIKYLRINQLLNKETLATIMAYYKDIEPKNKFDLAKVCGGLLTFLSSIGVVATAYDNKDVLKVIGGVIIFAVVMLVLIYMENKFLTKLFEGVLDNTVNYKKIYRMLNGIYIDVINNKLQLKESVKILDESKLEEFSNLYNKYLGSYKLSWFLRSKKDDFSKENIIHSSIIWTRFCVEKINESKIFAGSREQIELFTLISIIATLKESIDQTYRVLYNDNTSNLYTDNKELCFNDLPEPYNNLTNSDVFMSVRALFAAHPSNLKMPNDQNDRRYADMFYVNGAIGELVNRKGDFYTKIWTRTKNDNETLCFPLYVNDLIEYTRLIYSQIDEFILQLKKLAKKGE